MLNVDSLFDAENIISVAKKLQLETKVLLRVNPEFEWSSSMVHHQYLATSLKDSKFGIPSKQLDSVTRTQTLLLSSLNVVIRKHCFIRLWNAWSWREVGFGLLVFTATSAVPSKMLGSIGKLSKLFWMFARE